MPFRVYIDTSVVGGCIDEEFRDGSLAVFAAARGGGLVLLVSDVLVRELETAPPAVRNVMTELPEECIEVVSLTPEVGRLRDAYVATAVVSKSHVDDATHVAAATIAEADAIVSWNFRHIVRLDRIKAYNEINRRFGYRELTIISPIELGYEDQRDAEQDI